MCDKKKYYDNGYILGYYCEISGNKCDCEGVEITCPQYKESEKEDE